MSPTVPTLVTGAAGFIGMATAERLLQRGERVVGIDNLNDYYDPALKRARLQRLQSYGNFSFERLDIADRMGLGTLFKTHKFVRVIHLAAQAGVRYSIQNPHAYGESNLVGFLNVLEACRQFAVTHLVYASSSSVYGGNPQTPFTEEQGADHPVSLYAATKRANELMAHSYSHLYGLPTTGLRFFTVYGPWSRPDMVPFLFAKAMVEGRTIDVFNHGRMRRDFTYIDDIVEGVVRTLDRPPVAGTITAGGESNAGGESIESGESIECGQPTHGRPFSPDRSSAPYRVFNIGNSQPVELMDCIAMLERAMGRVATKRFLPMQAGDVVETSACTAQLERWVGFKPSTPLEVGLRRFADWYKGYYGVP